MKRWEYLTIFIQAEAKFEMDFLLSYSDWKGGVPRNTPEAMIPRLNALGEQGWELITMQPVVVGDNRDVMVSDSGGGSRNWTSTYFCVFKRAVED